MIIRILAWAYLALLIQWSGVMADADFLDVRTRLKKNHSDRKGGAVDKYFRAWKCYLNAGAHTNGVSQMSLRSLSIYCCPFLRILTTWIRFHAHYDGRFADKQVGKHKQLDHLTTLMQTFLHTMADIGAETWIMHGTLLGWWWNQKVRSQIPHGTNTLPWSC
jgi:hypothetical protein